MVMAGRKQRTAHESPVASRSLASANALYNILHNGRIEPEWPPTETREKREREVRD